MYVDNGKKNVSLKIRSLLAHVFLYYRFAAWSYHESLCIWEI